jgi:ethanolamine utilization microcompartment shell protein EutS
VALVKKDEVPTVLLNVGTTAQPTAMLTTQPPWELHMRGYDAEAVVCTLQVMTETGTTQYTEVQRWLTQLGTGPPATMEVVDLPTVSEILTMVKMTITFDMTEGWKHVRAAHVADFLEQIMTKSEFAQIIVREGTGSATVQVHRDRVRKTLRASGQAHIYTKVHPDETANTSELLFLPPGTSYRMAMEAASKLGDVALGVIKKTGGSEPRYGIRFAEEKDMAKFAQDQGIADQTRLGKYTISGITPQMGPEGIKTMMLAGLGWTVEEVLYVGEVSAVVAANACPKANKMALKKATGAPTIMHVKASNAKAREAFKTANLAFRSTDQEGDSMDTSTAIEADTVAWHRRRTQPRNSSPKRPNDAGGGGDAQRQRMQQNIPPPPPDAAQAAGVPTA